MTADPAPATVLICSRERPAMLLDTVRSVLDAARVPRELLVIDQSTTPNAELAAMGTVRGCAVTYLNVDEHGLSRARNLGLRSAREEIVVMLDDDMLVERDWLDALLAGLSGDDRAVVTGRVLAAPSEHEDEAVPPAALVERDTPAVYRGPQAGDVVPGANVAFRRALGLELGGFDERLGAGSRFAAADDNDFGHRLLLAGCEVRHVPEAVVYHRAWRRRRGRARLRWLYGRGKGAFYAKHVVRGDRHLRRRAAEDVRKRLGRAAAALASSPRVTAAQLVSLAGMLAGAVEWVVRERLKRP